MLAPHYGQDYSPRGDANIIQLYETEQTCLSYQICSCIFTAKHCSGSSPGYARMW